MATSIQRFSSSPIFTIVRAAMVGKQLESATRTKSSDKKVNPLWLLLQVVTATLSLALFFFLAWNTYTKVIPTVTPHFETENQILGVETQDEKRVLPVRLKIPSINVDAAIEHVDLTTNAEMATPKNTINVGWFIRGPIPGKIGSAVIAGHSDGENGEAGVFANLHKLRTGVKVYIEDDAGGTTVFIVRESRSYDPGYVVDVFGPSDKAYLNLVTCDGSWSKAKKSYTKRLVVFADILDRQ